jgi:hypothetical protein
MNRLLNASISLLTVVCLSGILTARGTPAADPSAPAPKAEAGAADPEFSRESGKEAFNEARGLFSKGEYREAEKLFKKARSDAASKEDRLVVEKWAVACTGAMLLERLKKIRAPTRLKAYDQAHEYMTKFRGTPAEPLYKDYLRTLEPQIFVPLEDFSVASPRYSPKFGKTFITKPELSLDGSQFLEWKSTSDRKASALKVTPSSPTLKNWAPFEAIEFWVCVKVPPRGLQVVVMCEGAAANTPVAAPGAAKQYFYAPVPLPSRPGQWKRVRMKFSEMKTFGRPQISSVNYFQLQMPAGIQYDFLVDEIALIRREASTPPRR